MLLSTAARRPLAVRPSVSVVEGHPQALEDDRGNARQGVHRPYCIRLEGGFLRMRNAARVTRPVFAGAESLVPGGDGGECVGLAYKQPPWVAFLPKETSILGTSGTRAPLEVS